MPWCNACCVYVDGDEYYAGDGVIPCEICGTQTMSHDPREEITIPNNNTQAPEEKKQHSSSFSSSSSGGLEPSDAAQGPLRLLQGLLLGQSGGGQTGSGSFGDAMSEEQLQEFMQAQLSEQKAKPTSAKFLKRLVPRPLIAQDFTGLAVRVVSSYPSPSSSSSSSSMPASFVARPTVAIGFGRELRRGMGHSTREQQLCAADSDSDAKSSSFSASTVQVNAVVYLPDPLTGSELGQGQNEREEGPGKGKCVVVERGDIEFGAKAAGAAREGALAVVVIQTQEKWPHHMSDSTGKFASECADIPALMISREDGAKLKRRVAENTKAALQTRLEIATVARELFCSVCREDLKLGDEAVMLPCEHTFCFDCIHPWLEKQNTCPDCRYELPLDDTRASGGDMQELFGQLSSQMHSRVVNDTTQHASHLYS
jgi:hypothetical protein